jgi:hypothetical protein
MLHRFDKAGAAVACACACHCVLSPILLSLSAGTPFWSSMSESAERVFLALSVALGVGTLGFGYVRYHRRIGPLAFFIAGFCIITASRRLFTDGTAFELFGVLAGAVLLIAAHRHNAHCCKQCRK